MTLTPARPIIIDTDPGQDDAVAILLALASPELQVLAITAVAGNVPLALTTRNARILLELAGRQDIPVYAGAIRPLVRPLVTAENVHGKTEMSTGRRGWMALTCPNPPCHWRRAMRSTSSSGPCVSDLPVASHCAHWGR